ncbi:Tyrosine-protein kinase receptor ver-4 [Bienertia sinuspersici]
MAASSLRRALATKPNTLLFQPSQLSSFSTNDSPPFSLSRVGQSTIVSESNPNKNCRHSSLPNPAFTRYRPIYPYAIRKLAARKSTRPRGRVFLRVSLFVSSCFTLKLEYEELKPDKIALEGGEQYLKISYANFLVLSHNELNAIFSKPLKELLSTKIEVDDAALISIDSRGIDVQVRQGAQEIGLAFSCCSFPFDGL